MGTLAVIAMVIGFAVIAAFFIALILIAVEVFVIEPQRRRDWELSRMGEGMPTYCRDGDHGFCPLRPTCTQPCVTVPGGVTDNIIHRYRPPDNVVTFKPRRFE